jgi:predicted dehydrogenase
MSKLVNDATRRQLAEYPGGSMFELGCHIIDLVVGVLGAPDAVHAFPRHSATADDDLLDNMFSVFEYPGATASVRSSVNEVDGFARRHFVLCGSGGTFHIQPLDSPKVRVAFRVEHGKYQAGYQDIEFPQYSRYAGDAAELARVIRQEADPLFSYDHDLAVQRAVLLSCGLPTD